MSDAYSVGPHQSDPPYPVLHSIILRKTHLSPMQGTYLLLKSMPTLLYNGIPTPSYGQAFMLAYSPRSDLLVVHLLPQKYLLKPMLILVLKITLMAMQDSLLRL
jgi:hypothetical protein